MDVKTLWSNKTSRFAIVSVSTLVVLGAVWAVLGATGTAPSWMPTPFDTADGGATGSSGTQSAVGEEPAPLRPASTGGAAAGDGSGTSTDDGAGTDDGATTDDPAGDDPAGDDAAGDDAGDRMTLRILWWNDTEKVAPIGFEVAVGTVTWSPADAKAESGVGSLSGLEYGRELSLVVYPDGPSGTRVTVPILLTDDMVSNSDSDAVHVEVRDDTVRVLGTPVKNFDVTYDRR